MTSSRGGGCSSSWSGLGVEGVTILGVLGESNRLYDAERKTLIEGAVSAVAKRVPIIVGTSAPGTRTAVYLSRMAQDLGADAVMVTPAKEAVPNDDRVFELYQQISKAVTIPIVLQDHPGSTDVHMPAALILRVLRALPGVACVKEEAVPTAPKIRQVREGLTERSVPILSGLGALYAPFDLEAGCDGFNTGFAFPEVLQALVSAARAGDWPLVHHLYSRFAALIVFEQQPGVAVRKEIPPAERAADVRPRAASGGLRFGGTIGAARCTARAHAARRRHHEAHTDCGTGGFQNGVTRS